MRLTIQQSRVVLGVSSDATPEQVRQAYRKLALQFHPDKNADPSATETFQRLSAAYKRLCDHEQRHRGNSAGSNQHTHGSASESDDAALDSDDGSNSSEFDDMDISFDEMLMMFEMLFGSTVHAGSRARKKPTITTKKAAATTGRAPQVHIARRGGRTNARRGGASSGRSSSAFTKAPLFSSADDNLFESFLAMELAREMNGLEDDFMAMNSLFGCNGDSDASICSDDERLAMDDLQGFARAMKMPLPTCSSRSARARQRSARHTQNAPSPTTTQQPHDGASYILLVCVCDARLESSHTRSLSLLAQVVTQETKSETIEASPTEASPTEASPIELEATVRVFGKLLGVVKFHGGVHYAKGNFVGVQLSEPLGKNDGTVKGVVYFACPPQCGLMVRPEDVALVE